MHRKGMYLHNIEMDTDQKKCLVGFHAFTGNDHISSFFEREKDNVGELLKRIEIYHYFHAVMWDLNDEIFHELEEYICPLYGCRLTKVDDAIHNIFENKINTDKGNRNGTVISLPLFSKTSFATCQCHHKDLEFC